MSRRVRQHRPSVSRSVATSQSSSSRMSNLNFAFAPPLFNGRDGSFCRFLSDFEIFASLHSWSENEQLKYLPLCLTGLAREAFESLERTQRQSFSVTVGALRQCFAPLGVVEAHAKLQVLSFDPSESVEVFLIRFKAAVRAAFPGENQDRLLFTYFLSSLPMNIRTEVIAAGCESFDQAVAKTKCVVAARRAADVPTQSTTAEVPVRRVENDAALAKLLSRLESLELKVEQAITNGPQVAQSAPAPHIPGPCYACGHSGHVRANCRYSSATCHACGKRGHIKPACRTKNAELGGQAAPSGTRESSRWSPQRTQ